MNFTDKQKETILKIAEFLEERNGIVVINHQQQQVVHCQ